MARIPLRLAGPVTVTTGGITLFTVPATHKYLVTQIHWMNAFAGVNSFGLSIGVPASATELFTNSIQLLANGVYDFRCELTLEAAETLQSFTSAGNMTAVVMGWDITLG